MLDWGLASPGVVPLASASEISVLEKLPGSPPMIELDGWDEAAHGALRRRYPETLICVRLPFEHDLASLARQGIRVFHLTANYHGRAGNAFVLDAIRSAHEALVAEAFASRRRSSGAGALWPPNTSPRRSSAASMR